MDRHVEGGSPAETLVSLVRDRAAQTPDRMAFAFLVDGEGDQVELSCADLEREARRVASLIGERVAPGGRAVLVFEPGLDFLGAFFGCLFAGVTAVPVYPPFPQQLEAGLARLGGVLEDSEAGAVLASRALIGLADLMANGGGAPWIESDAGDGDPDGWRDPGVRPSTVAIMQYTSGSTSEPRGVVLHHEHVIANLRSIDWFLGGAAHGPSVSWLPTYHDMGLIGGVIYNLSRGRPTHLLSPLHCLKRPGRWLELVSGVRATVTGGPNFAYELAVRRSTEEERAGLDLSCLDICFIGAEPLRAETVRRFEEAFAGSGLRAGTVLGCYGLAEASLLVAGAQRGPSRTATLDAGEFGRGRAVPTGAGMGRTVEAVSSGGTPPGHDVRIVDPVAAEEVPTGRIGEIWFHGPSVAEGYWHRPELTEATFGARLHPEDDPTRRYLRTGDLT